MTIEKIMPLAVGVADRRLERHNYTVLDASGTRIAEEFTTPEIPKLSVKAVNIHEQLVKTIEETLLVATSQSPDNTAILNIIQHTTKTRRCHQTYTKLRLMKWRHINKLGPKSKEHITLCTKLIALNYSLH